MVLRFESVAGLYTGIENKTTGVKSWLKNIG
nr:MAG TPA: hypothetical protein [Caudoviricetes sp.]